MGIARDITSRKQVEKDLQKTHDELEKAVEERTAELVIANKEIQKEQEKFRFLAENMGDVVWTLDMDLRTTYVSSSIEKVLGFTPEERKRQALEEMLTPESLDRAQTMFFEELSYDENGDADPDRSVTIEAEYYHKDGSTVWMESNMKAMRNHTGAIYGVYGVSRDISERKQAEDKLINSRMKYRQKTKVLDGINKVFREALTCENETDVADTCLSVAENLTGSKFGLIGELNPDGLFDIISISDPGWGACKMLGSEATRSIKNMEIRGIDRSTIREEKSRIVNDLASHPDRVGTPESHPQVTSFLGVLLKHAGKTIGMIGLGNKDGGYDFHDQEAIEALSVAFVEALMRKRAEESLKKSEERFRTVADFTYNWENWIDPDGNYIYVSPAFERITGYAPHVLIQDNQFYKKFIHPDDLNMVSEHVHDHLDKENVGSMEYRLITHCGDTRWISHTCQAVYDSDGKFLGRRTSNQDITEQKKIERQFIQAQKMESIGTLAGGIAHDFNNILSSIIGYTELTMDDVDKGTLLHDNLSEVVIAGNRAKNLVKQILTISREDKRKIKPIQINSLIKEALKMLRSTIPTSIEFQENLCSDPLIVQADATQIHQVIVNLATNAKQAMVNGSGVLEVGVDTVSFESDVKKKYPDMQPGNYARITISDTGSGIPEKDLEKLYEPYFTTKKNGEGTGLGLSVVHGIVKSHNGYITVYSELGKGTTFHVYLPLVKKASVDLPEKSAEPLPTGTERVLLVDDELPIVKMQQQNLERLGYTVTARTSSVEALEAFRASPGKFDLVITDMTMPNMTGDKLARELKAIRSEIPIILCTGFSEKIDGHEERLDIDGFLMKPVDKAKMAKTVRKVLDEIKG